MQIGNTSVIQRGRGFGEHNRYRAAFTLYPTQAMLVRAQSDAGYSPFGYGGPDGVRITQSGDTFHAEWHSESTCD